MRPRVFQHFLLIIILLLLVRSGFASYLDPGDDYEDRINNSNNNNNSTVISTEIISINTASVYEPSVSSSTSPSRRPRTIVRKCCPPGLKMFWLKVTNTEADDVTCKIAESLENAGEHIISSHLWMVTADLARFGFPATCSKFKFVPLDKIPPREPAVFCVDKLVDIDEFGTATEQLAAGICVAEVSLPNEQEQEPQKQQQQQDKSMPLTVTKVVPFRKCCSSSEKYDLFSRSCVRQHDSDPLLSRISPETKSLSNLLSMVFDKNLSAFVDVSVGFPNCSIGLVDVAIFHIDYDDFLINSEGFATLTPAYRRNSTGSETWILPPEDFCMDNTRNTSGFIIVRTCHPDPKTLCKNYGCLHKCCPHGMYYGQDEMGKHSCVPASRPFLPQINRSALETADSTTNPIANNVDLINSLYNRFVSTEQPQQVIFSSVSGDPCTKGKYRLSEDAGDEYSLDDLGDLYVMGINKSGYFVLQKEKYCAEDAIDDSLDVDGFNVFMCLPTEDAPLDDTNNLVVTLITSGLLLSSVFLVATLITYCLLPSLQNLHGKTLMCHVTSLLFAYLMLACNQILTRPGILQSDWMCMAIGNGVLFTFLSAFSWLNVMCIDIYRTFGSARSSRTLKRSNIRHRFRMYCLYSWGLSSVITALCVLADVWPGDEKSALRPQMGDGGCWFGSNSYGILIFFVGPLLIQTCVNLVLFLLTARNYCRIKDEISRFQDSMNPRRVKKLQSDSNKLNMNAKLFVVMGVTWVLEAVSTFFPDHTTVFYLSDTANALHGVMIFCIFVLKDKVLKDLKARLLGRRKSGSGLDTNTSVMNIDSRMMSRKTASNSTLFTSEFRCSGFAGRVSPGRGSCQDLSNRTNVSF